VAVSELGTPFFRESGVGTGVVCLHSNASTSGQWRQLVERLSTDFRVIAADTLGAGRSPEWPNGQSVTLRDEVDFLEPVFERAGDPFYLVGHSYGGALALVAAIAHPERVSKMVLYEPTLFSLLAEESPDQAAFKEIYDVADAAASDIKLGDDDKSAERFIDYWMGKGSWAATPETLREPIAASMVNVAGWATALRGDPTPLRAFSVLDMPVLYMVGERSPSSSKGVARLLESVLPNADFRELKGLGHMAPITHPNEINELVEEFVSNR